MTDATNGEALLPCPFCGGKMEDRGYGALHIDGKGCPIGDLAIPVPKWNHRQPTASAGMVVVPREPTEVMVNAARFLDRWPLLLIGQAEAIYKTMLAAHESQPEPNKRPIVWQHDTPYGPGYSFESLEVIEALSRYVNLNELSGNSGKLPTYAGHEWPVLDRLLLDAYSAGTDGLDFSLFKARGTMLASLNSEKPPSADTAEDVGERVPSKERGCDGKINLGRDYQTAALRMSFKHNKQYGVYRCPHCEGAHLTTRLDKADQYAPLLYVTPEPTDNAEGE